MITVNDISLLKEFMLGWVYMEIVVDMYQLKHFSLDLFKLQTVFRRQNLNFLGGSSRKKIPSATTLKTVNN